MNAADTKSFGSIFGRSHDGDTVATHKVVGTNPHEQQTTITFTERHEGLSQSPDTRVMAHDEQSSLGMSTAAETTGTTRAKLRYSEERAASLYRENQELFAKLRATEEDSDDSLSIKTTPSTRNKLQHEIDCLRAQITQQSNNSHHSKGTNDIPWPTKLSKGQDDDQLPNDMITPTDTNGTIQVRLSHSKTGTSLTQAKNQELMGKIYASEEASEDGLSLQTTPSVRKKLQLEIDSLRAQIAHHNPSSFNNVETPSVLQVTATIANDNGGNHS